MELFRCNENIFLVCSLHFLYHMQQRFPQKAEELLLYLISKTNHVVCGIAISKLNQYVVNYTLLKHEYSLGVFKDSERKAIQ